MTGTSCWGELRDWKEAGMCRTDRIAVRQRDDDGIGGRLEIFQRTIEAKIVSSGGAVYDKIWDLVGETIDVDG